MKKNSFIQNLAAGFVIIGALVIVSLVAGAIEPKCVRTGCNNERADGSSYCYLHKPYSGSGTSSYGGTSYGSKSSSGSTSDSYSNKSNTTTHSSYGSSTSGSYSNKSSTTTHSSYGSSPGKKTYESYDDGYDDIYMDGDYDYDRYDEDSDYADGVDDAIDEFGGDW